MPVSQALPAGPFTPGGGTPGPDVAEIVAFLKQKGNATDGELSGSGYLYRGVYAAATTYAVDDMANYLGTLWIATAAGSGFAPPAARTTESNARWTLWLAKGDAGPIGPSGNVYLRDTAYLEPMPIWDQSGAVATVSGVLRLVYGTAQTAVTVASLATATQDAGVGLTLWRMALFTVNTTTGDLTRVTITANDTTSWATGFTTITGAVTAAAIAAGQRYAIGLLTVGGTTQPMVAGGYMGPVGSLLRRTGDGPATGKATGQTDIAASYTATSIINSDDKVMLVGRP